MIISRDMLEGCGYFTVITTTIKLAITFLQLARKKPVIVMRETPSNHALLSACPAIFNFNPTPLYCLDYYGTIQTIGQTILRDTARIFSRIRYRRELFTLSDHGTVGLDWVETYKEKQLSYEKNTSTVIIMHGLCGDSNAEYLVHLVEVLIDRGYRVVVMVARGCGGVPLTTPVPFNGARTIDFKETVDYVHSLYPDSRLYGMGYSLGACLLLRYLSDYSDPQINRLTGGIAVSPPWDFQVRSSFLFELIWTRLLALLLKSYLIKNSTQLKEHFWKILFQTFTIRQFDSIACKYSGYRDLEEYYDDCTPASRVHLIQTPLLAISSIDDPICNVNGYPKEKEKYGEGLITVIVEHGGHLGFAEEIFPLNSSWTDRLAIEFFAALGSGL